ncbi:thiamine-phosphate synthase [Actinoplanes philippinensis]|uniref:Thiamine-phosphate pyrophosphorylase/hydroxymethylpyrimidine kinase / phosphomethylpyrimidine kinase / thiamine-phosphate diphosphorylase n=1 Tax=Actinoplanes philippinensis TaxID=35752 RepID=A0A1I2IPV0_9ACTN|nr:thiamine phosphate synthase [Actinoplanes philippinensis]GIE79147.1 thiamine-phosphate synthase [Actinoplanes philippinensis]SFF43730.1 thiamine-phosphate pyrophosphorylase/hydroxymethylpyrimidine kinase / phosphomethylpyrimidine kinase / thiamine-phosphate diphosphorylase [Actinoplanes philippinensis]
MVTPGGLVVLTDRRSASGPLIEVVRKAVRGGADWVILRERDLSYGERAALATGLRSVVPDHRLIIAGPDPLGGTAVHLSGSDQLPEGTTLTGRSWHGTEDLSGVDYVTVSPVYPTLSKPGYGPALGATGAAEMRAPVPWLALGGIETAAQAAECALAGAAGIAVMGALMRSPDPERTARELSSAFRSAAGRGSCSEAVAPALAAGRGFGEEAW